MPHVLQNSESRCHELHTPNRREHDHIWRIPLDDRLGYGPQIHDNTVDLVNICPIALDLTGSVL